MTDIQNRKQKTKKLTYFAFLMALVIVLQTISAFLTKFGFFSVSLVLVPIVVGGMILGVGYGTALGFTFGALTLFFAIIGLDAGGNMLFVANPIMLILVCLVKASAAAFLSALIYKIIARKNVKVASFVAAIVAPVTNTLIFCVSMFIFFKDSLNAWAGGTNVFLFTITGLVGVNFLIELGINIVLCPTVGAIARKVVKKRIYE